jgi:6-pyruvoyl-tetrahydropterin synthase
MSRRRARDARHVDGHRLAWRARGVDVLAQRIPRLPVPWGGSALDYVAVPDDAWTAEPWTFPGATKVLVSWPPGKPLDLRGWARQWNRAYGYPLYGPPWRWEYQPAANLLVGEIFDLGGPDGRMPLPADISYRRHAYRAVIGQCEDGTVLTWDILDIPNVLIGGSAGFGKSKVCHLIAYHLLAAEVLQGLVVLDWKRRDYQPFTNRTWNPDTCTGITVAKPNLSDVGMVTDLADMEAACQVVLAEMGRRMLQAEEVPEGEDPWRERLVLLLVDEAAATLQREKAPANDDKSPEANAIRVRNRQRANIEWAISQVAMLGRALHIHLVAGAQSPRKEFLPGEAVANMQHRMFMGLYQDVAEPVIIFGKDAPDSPPGWKGYGVWRSTRSDADPHDPYLYFRAFWLDADRVRTLLDARELVTADGGRSVQEQP